MEEIRDKIKRYKLSYVWLINELEKRDIYTDKTEMSSVLSGTRKGQKADSIIEVSEEILANYEQRFLQ